MLKKPFDYISILSFFTFLIFIGCAVAPEKTQPEPGEPVAYSPKMKVGDKWKMTGWSRSKRTDIYHTEIVEVNEDGSFAVLKRAEKAGETWYEYYNNKFQQEMIVYPSTGKTITQEKPLRNSLDFPIFVGKSWKTAYSAISKGGRLIEYLDKYKVISYETIKTKAGEFKAFKISRTNSLVDHRSYIYNSVEWYCPELKLKIKVTNPDFPPLELLDYNLVMKK